MLKTGWSGAIRLELLVGGVGTDAVEEGADLPFPLLQVGAQQRGLLVLGDLGRGELLERRRRARRPPPLARMLRTHWVWPRGATR